MFSSLEIAVFFAFNETKKNCICNDRYMDGKHERKKRESKQH